MLGIPHVPIRMPGRVVCACCGTDWPCTPALHEALERAHPLSIPPESEEAAVDHDS